jgi:lipopolysaccharide/colanic/teichoic acid biosynthesis glycosyltransferase
MFVEKDICLMERSVRIDTLSRGNSTSRQFWNRVGKPAAESCMACVLLVLTAPLILLAAALVRLTSRGPAFYSQQRLGRHGRVFTIYKLRTMIHDCEKLTGPRWAAPADPRITPIGRFLRRTHLDELPQLLNVIRGQMGLVGPRPERPEIVVLLEKHIPRYRDRLLVRPGLTGLAQVQLPPDTDLASVRTKLAHDLYYIQHLSLLLDVRILLSTACYLAGIPFVTSQSFCRVPAGRSVELAYQHLTGEKDPVLQMQSA